MTTLEWALPIKKTATHIKEYCGVADCHGVESFMCYPPDERMRLCLGIRAAANRHRHAVYYIVRLNDVDAERIRGFITDEKHEKALQWLKEYTVNGECQLSDDDEDVAKSWKLIPDSSLDPWG